MKKMYFFSYLGGPGGPLRRTQVNENIRAVKPHHRPDICITREQITASFSYMVHNIQQGNSVARDLPPTGSEANTTIVVFLYILDIDSHCPYLLLFF